VEGNLNANMWEQMLHQRQDATTISSPTSSAGLASLVDDANDSAANASTSLISRALGKLYAARPNLPVKSSTTSSSAKSSIKAV